MKEKFTFDFSDEERSLILQSLTSFRNYLISQDISPEPVIDIILQLSDNHRINISQYEKGIIIKALNIHRYKLKSQNQPRSGVNDLLLRLMDEDGKKKPLLRKLTRGNGRR